MSNERWFNKQHRALASKAAGLCVCWKCMGERDELRAFMVLCPECGNKRCPKASNHELACTGSNEPGQAGSVYTGIPASLPAPSREDIDHGRE